MGATVSDSYQNMQSPESVKATAKRRQRRVDAGSWLDCKLNEMASLLTPA